MDLKTNTISHIYLALCLLVMMVEATTNCSDPPPGCSCPKKDVLQCVCDSGHQISELPDIPHDVTFLVFLNCPFSKISRVEYPTVESMHILNSDILSIIDDSAFSSMQNLLHLDFSGSNLRNLTKNMFYGLESLKSLKVQNSGLKKIAANAFEELPSLELLDLSRNTGLDLPSGVFSGNTKLNTIEVRRCGFKTIPDAVSKVVTLKELDIDGNSLEVLNEGALSSLKQLTTIGLDNCALQTISEKAFDGLTELLFLNLGNNLISHISARHFESFRDKLTDLWLADNQLQSLSVDVLNWAQMRTITLGHNPWTCDCSVHWMRELQNKHEDRDNATCARPGKYAGKSLYNVTAQMDCSHQGGSKSAVALAVAIPVIIICCLLISYFAYQIIKNKRKGRRKSVRYSAVYKDTVESARSRPL